MTGCEGIAINLIIKTLFHRLHNNFIPVLLFVVVENHFRGRLLICTRRNEISPIDHNYQRLL